MIWLKYGVAQSNSLMRIYFSELVNYTQNFFLKCHKGLPIVTFVVPIFNSSFKHKVNFYDPSKTVMFLIFSFNLVVLFHELELQV